MIKKILSTCVVTCSIALTVQAQTIPSYDGLNLQNLNMTTRVPQGMQLLSATPFASQQAVGFVGLQRQYFYTKTATGNDLTDKVGLWIKGYYQSYGGSVPIFLGGSGFNSDEAKVTIASNGNVGIGAAEPVEKLQVHGNIYMDTPTESANGWNATYFQWWGHSLVMGSKPGTVAHNVLDLKPGGCSTTQLVSYLNLHTALNETTSELKVSLASTGPSYFNGGNVGIGTKTPQSLFSVNGEITAKKIRVLNTGWADFVFQPEYKLPALADVRAFIKSNGHLPEIPSAAEVEKNGVELGEMNKKLLQKVEELTLYILEQQDQLKKQDDKMAAQDEVMMALQQRLAALEQKSK